MTGFVNGLYKLCDDAVPVIVAIAAVAFLILGVKSIIQGEEGRIRFKTDILYIVGGSGLALLAVELGKTVTSWFM